MGENSSVFGEECALQLRGGVCVCGGGGDIGLKTALQGVCVCVCLNLGVCCRAC